MHYISTITLILCFLGIGASVHDLVIEVRKEADPDYVALVDLGENLSCTAVLTSKWGRGFGIVGKIFGEDHFLNIRNPYFGFLFYGMVIILSQMKKEAAKIQLAMVIKANLASVYLSYILFILKNFCIASGFVYAVNLGLLVTSYLRYKDLISKAKRQ